MPGGASRVAGAPIGNTGGPRYDPFLGQWVGGGGGQAPQQQQQPAAPIDYGPPPANGPGGDNRNPGMDGLIPPPSAPTAPAPAPVPDVPEPEQTDIGAPMPTSMSAMTQPIPAPSGAINANLGRRIYPQSMRALTEMAGRNY